MNRILIIDDDEELCELVAEFLGAEGFQTETAHDGESGLRKALSNEYDLITLDVMLPKKTVLTFCANFVKHRKFLF